MHSMKMYGLAVGFMLVACGSSLDADEPGELVIHHADDTGLAGEYRTRDTIVTFETRADDTGIAAAFFDQHGVRLAATYPGKTPPADWGDAGSLERSPDAGALDLLPETAQALAAEPRPGAEALITLGAPSSGDDPLSPTGGSYGRCDHYVEYTAWSATGYPCWQAVSYLQGRYAECSAWVRYSWKYTDHQNGGNQYFCTAAAIY